MPESPGPRPSSARVWNFLLGGTNNDSADRRYAAELEQAYRGTRRIAVSSRRFLGRAAGWAAEQGISQFVDLGSGCPPPPHVHQMARAVRPGAVAAYADSDAETAAELWALLAGDDRKGTAVVTADYRDPPAVLAHPGLLEVIDPGAPVCLTAAMTLHLMPPRVAAAVTALWVRAVAPGSIVVLSVPRFDDAAAWGRLTAMPAAAGAHNFRPAEFAALFAGLEVVPPGIGPATWLRPGGAPCAAGGTPTGGYVLAGIGVKVRLRR